MTDTPNAKSPHTDEPNAAPAEALSTEAPASENASATGLPVDASAALAETQAKAAEYLEGWQRARADFANYRKRADKERDDAYQNAVIETLRRLIPVIDDFERAVLNVPAERAEEEIIKGFGLIHRKLAALIEGAGLKAVDPRGEPFNPTFHEALGHEDNPDVPSGHVSTVLQKGYIYGDRVIRPALVRVSD